jgi:microcystin-dependent protein
MDSPIIGEIRLAASENVPYGWAPCDGQLLRINEHRALHAVIGNRFGGDGYANFALPDLRGRVALHADGGDYAVGTSGGAARHALTVAELPAHSHALLLAAADSDASGGVAIAAGLAEADVVWPGEAVVEGQGTAHENMQPYLGLVFLIALTGQSPNGN